MLSFTSPTGSGEDRAPSSPRPSTPVNNPQPVLGEIQYVLGTLPPQGTMSSTRGTSMKRDSSLNRSSNSSFNSLIQKILQETKSRRNRQTTKTRSTAAKTATIPNGTRKRRRTRRRICSKHSRGESPETESFGTTSSEEYSDY
nr:MAG: ORF3 [Giant panda anellovirus]